MSCLCPIGTCFFVTCPRLDENDGTTFNKIFQDGKKICWLAKKHPLFFVISFKTSKVRHLTSDIDIALLPRETILFLENLNVSKSWEEEHRCWFIVTCPVTKLTNERQSMHCRGKKFSYVANTCIPNLYVKPFFVRE